MTKLALFDLDNTLIAGDSDVLWGEYLVENGLVDGEAHQREDRRFYQDYLDGCLDIDAFLRFQLRILTQHPLAVLHAWRDEFVRRKIEPALLPKARKLIQLHRDDGAILLIITATNRFITEPVAALYGVEHLIAPEPEMRDGQYTGAIQGVPSFAGGKITRLRAWQAEHGINPETTWFYSDSHNDLPLLKAVDKPVAVNPDPKLEQTAQNLGWPIMDLRDN